MSRDELGPLPERIFYPKTKRLVRFRHFFLVRIFCAAYASPMLDSRWGLWLTPPDLFGGGQSMSIHIATRTQSGQYDRSDSYRFVS